MPLLHIEHPEDAILTGDLDVLSWFSTPGRLSVKIDGSPAIVWGTDPKDGKFFVGTKSVFNKKTPKLIKSIKDLEKHGYCLLYTSPSPRDRTRSRMPSSA